MILIFFKVRLYEEENGNESEEELVDNTLTITLNNNAVETAKNNNENIFLPSEYWDELIETSIDVQNQPWFNEVELDVDGITNPLETLNGKELTQNLLNQTTNKITVSDLMTNATTNKGITKESTLIPKLTKVTNKRLTSSSVNVSDIINDSTSLGLSRSSTLILDPPVNNGDITITNNGQYSPYDFNSQGIYDPTHSAGWDYINQVNVDTTKILKITNGLYFRSSNGNIYGPYSFTRINSSITINISVGDEVIYCKYDKNNKTLTVYCIINAGSSGSITLSPSSSEVMYYWKNNYVPHANTYNVAILYETGGNKLIELRDLGAGDGESSVAWSYCLLGPGIAKVPY